MCGEHYPSCLGKTFRLSISAREHILRHPEMYNELAKIPAVLRDPDEVRASRQDPRVLLFYKRYRATRVTDKYLLVATKLLNAEGFIITAFFTDRMKGGSTVWRSG